MINEQIATGIGSAFAVTFWNVIKDELPKNFKWEKFKEQHKPYIAEKLSLYYIKLPNNEELTSLIEIANKSFEEECDKIQASLI